MLDIDKYQELKSQNIEIVEDAPPQPDHTKPMDRRQVIEQMGPTLVDGVWHTQWMIRTLTQQEQQQYLEQNKQAVVSQRNKFLAASDIYVLPDRWESYTTEQKQQWTTFRQQLRDITKQAGFPYTITWPTHPKGSYE